MPEDLTREWDGAEVVGFDEPRVTWTSVCIQSTRLEPPVGVNG